MARQMTDGTIAVGEKAHVLQNEEQHERKQQNFEEHLERAFDTKCSSQRPPFATKRARKYEKDEAGDDNLAIT